MALAPIALFAYNRPSHFQKTVEALRSNALAKDSDLFIFSDAPKNEKIEENVAKVRKYAKGISGFHSLTVVERRENFGLARSITSGVTEIVNRFGVVIVLEDDLVTSPYFLKFMNEGLEFYKDSGQVVCIHGYIYPIKAKLPETYFIRGADCLGWATWRRGWDLFEPDSTKLLGGLKSRNLEGAFDMNGAYPFARMLRKQAEGKIDSWAIRWYASAFLQEKLTLYPGESLIRHIGNIGGGTNYFAVRMFDVLNVDLHNKPISIRTIPVEEDTFASGEIARYLRKTRKYQIINRLIRLFLKAKTYCIQVAP